MATIEKKFLSLEGLQKYDAKIKAKMDVADEAIFEAAKKYTDDAPFDPAGTAQTKMNELANGAVKGNTDAIAAINDEETGILKQAMDYVDTFTAEGGKVTVLEGQVATLVGDDEDKSVRTIANEELAKQLIADNAKESLNELQEIAAWIQSHPDDASAMNQAIVDLTALVGTLPEGVTATTIVGYILEVVNAEKARAEGIEEDFEDRIQTVEAEFSTDTNNPGRVTVLENRAAALEGRATTLEGRADAIETSLAEGGDTAEAIAAAQKAGDDAQADVDALTEEGGKITILEEKVANLESVTYVEITETEINALFPTA